VKDKTNLWRLYSSATAYGKRPSDFVQLETEIAAWALDEACLMTGRKFENLINEGKNPFADAQTGKGSRTSYAPVASGNIKRVKIKENGTW
jgi:hypothetical protein